MGLSSRLSQASLVTPLSTYVGWRRGVAVMSGGDVGSEARFGSDHMVGVLRVTGGSSARG